jgi:hypothetical protein
MKYETPEVTALTPAIDAIQSTVSKLSRPIEHPGVFDGDAAYEDME